ncbi:MAG: type VI secretion system-associated FHA domain protein TagH [Rubrivivax sp.]|nr:type VI secretion system-associated FHA domain protein TagH [Rubrivivax sp.]
MLLLKIVHGAERATGVRPLVEVHSKLARFVIGRDPKCDWPIPDRELALSARHCEIVRAGGHQVLRDLSTNGTFVNGSRKRLAGDHVLRHGDRIVLGNYLVEVSVVSDAGEQPPQAPARTRLVRRGGDPAAMVGTDWQQAEAALGGAPSLEMNSGFTRISKPWLDTSTDHSSVFATVPNVRQGTFEDTGAPSETGALGPPTGVGGRPAELSTQVMQGLAAGLGVPVTALPSAQPAEAAQRVGRLLRVAMYALHHQLQLQSRQMRELGSRAATHLGGSPAAALRLAPGPQDAVGALLAAGGDGEAMLVRAHGELGQHTQRILAAFEGTCQRLAEHLDPAMLEQLAQGADDPARLWRTYGGLWQSMGLAEGKSWSQGFVDVAFTHLATSYDETPPTGPPPSARAGG